MHKCKPSRWLIGLIPLLILGYFVAVGMRFEVEGDLTRRAKAALADAGLPWATVNFEGRDAVISGQTGRENEQQRALNIVSRVYGVRLVQDQAELVARVSPYVWAAQKIRMSKVKKGIRLKGYMSSEKDRKEVLGIVQANFPGYRIDDEMKLASGAPSREIQLAAISFAIQQLKLLNRGGVSLSDNQVSLKGSTAKIEDLESISSAWKTSIPTGVVRGQFQVRAPKADPYFWSMDYNGDNVVLKGFVSSEDIRNDQKRLVRQLLPSARIEDQMQLASGAPKGFEQAANVSLVQISRLETGSASIRNGDVTIEGVSVNKNTTEDVRKTIEAALPKSFKAQQKISTKQSTTTIVSRVSPFVWSADRSTKMLTLSGFVPGEKLRQDLIRAAQIGAPDAKIIDAMKIGRGDISDAEFSKTAHFGLWQLGKLRDGSVRLRDKDVRISGEASSIDNYRAITISLRSGLPSNLSLVQKSIVPPRVSTFLWNAEYSDNKLLLTGFVPSDRARKSLVKFATSQFPKATIEDRMRLGSGAPQNWSDAAQFGIQQLAGLELGSVELRDSNLEVSGLANSTEKAQKLKSTVAGNIPGGFSSQHRIQVKPAPKSKAESTSSVTVARKKDAEQVSIPSTVLLTDNERVSPDVCQVLLNSALTSGTIRFRPGSSVIETESEPLLKYLGHIARRCPNSRIEISGHTDSDGSDELNMALSRERAEAVVKFLAADGVARTRLQAAGYGKSRPLVANTSDVNKAKNRRIEFKIIQ